ncbi:hypothetical protein [Rubrivivax gelatinosus]|uniref:hypothetical protein n=1 Tax=Rubrivivax gelatinosus TaxID=28068 RepID=UPI0005C188E4|nr:hypothetical protein [Rubrivivax gelatinosus]
MAILFPGVTTCPLCEHVIEDDRDIVATTQFLDSSDHPLWKYSDAVMHRKCFEAWDQRQFFVDEYNRLLGSAVFLGSFKHPMDDDGNVTTVSVHN